MALPESRKKANAKWDKENMITLGCKIRREHAAAFKSYCEEHGKKSNTVLKDYVLSCIGERDGAGGPQDAAGTPGGAALSPDVLGAAQAAAEATGEAPAAFVARAVQTQVERDKAFLKMGIDPATGNKLKREA